MTDQLFEWTWKRGVFCTTLVVLASLLVFATPLVSRAAFCDYTISHAASLIDEAMGKNLVTFATLSAIKAALALLEGSAVGVGFELEVGDLVQPIYDYVDFVWNFMLYAIMILGIYKLITETGILLIGLKLAGIGLFLVACGVVARPWEAGAFRWGRRCIVIGFLFTYVVPLALIATHYASVYYTAPVKAKYEARVATVKGQLTSARDEFVALKDEVSIMRPGESLETARKRLMRVLSVMESAVWGSAEAFIYFAAVIIFELFVFPLVSAFILYKFLHVGLDRILDTALPGSMPAPVGACVTSPGGGN